MSAELKRCPFCGISPKMSSMFGMALVHCPNCEADGGVGDTEELAIAIWNRRTPEPQQ